MKLDLALAGSSTPTESRVGPCCCPVRDDGGEPDVLAESFEVVDQEGRVQKATELTYGPNTGRYFFVITAKAKAGRVMPIRGREWNNLA